MKNKTKIIRFKLLISFFMLASISFLQNLNSQIWIPQISGTGNELHSVSFTSSMIGFIVGDMGTSLATINSGANWIPFNISGEDLNDVAFKNTFIGLIAGGNGKIFRTPDGGIMWNSVMSGVGSNLRTVSFGDNGVVYVAGDNGVILKSTNNGLSFMRIDSMNSSSNFNSASAKGMNFLILVGDGGIIRVTTNGGMTFTSELTGTDRDLRSVFFITSMLGFIGGKENTLLYTNDGGVNWTSRNSGLHLDTGDVSINSIFFLNALTGYAVGDHGSIFKTTNAGIFWMPENSQTMEDLNHVFFFDENHGWAVGHEGTIRFRGMVTGISPNSQTASKFNLDQNYPNPFNPSTKIKFELPVSGFVNLNIYDINGRTVATLINSKMNSGVYEFQFDASNFPSGVYFYQLKTAGFTETKKMTLIK